MVAESEQGDLAVIAFAVGYAFVCSCWVVFVDSNLAESLVGYGVVGVWPVVWLWFEGQAWLYSVVMGADEVVVV